MGHMATPQAQFKFAKLAGGRVRELRQAQGLRMAQLAKKAGFTQQQISQVELGRINTPVETLGRIAKALEVPVEVLFQFDSNYLKLSHEENWFFAPRFCVYA